MAETIITRVRATGAGATAVGAEVMTVETEGMRFRVGFNGFQLTPSIPNTVSDRSAVIRPTMTEVGLDDQQVRGVGRFGKGSKYRSKNRIFAKNNILGGLATSLIMHSLQVLAKKWVTHYHEASCCIHNNALTIQIEARRYL